MSLVPDWTTEWDSSPFHPYSFIKHLKIDDGNWDTSVSKDTFCQKLDLSSIPGFINVEENRFLQIVLWGFPKINIFLKILRHFSIVMKKGTKYKCVFPIFFFLGYYRSLYLLINSKLPSSIEYSDLSRVPIAKILLENILKPLHFTYSSCPEGARWVSEDWAVTCFLY